MDFGLKGKTALVLGGGGGLGRAIAKSLAAEGANVAVAGIGSTSIDGTIADLKAIGGKCLGLIWDLKPVPSFVRAAERKSPVRTAHEAAR